MRARVPAVLLLCATGLVAQRSPVDDTWGHSRHGAEFDGGPRQAAYLMQGLNPAVHFPVSGISPAAQAFFDQAVCQQHGFWYLEAERSFRQVAMLHPDCAMAYWGMALANVEDAKRAAGFIGQAVQRAKQATEAEQRWIDAWAKYLQVDDALRNELQSGDPEKQKRAREELVKRNEKRDEKKLCRDLVRDMEAMLRKEPHHVELRALLAIQLWRNEGHGLPINSHMAAEGLMDEVFRAVPGHPAHHFRVHIWDNEKAEYAVDSAVALGRSAPGIAHQWHMGGHIFAKLNRHADAAWQQEASSRVDHAFMVRDRVMPFAIHNYGHNQEWLARSLGHVGRVHDALGIATNLVELPRHPDKNVLSKGSDIAGYGRSRLLDLCEDHELWARAVELNRDGYLDPVEDTRLEAARLAVLGRARFRTGDTDGGASALADAQLLLAKARAKRAKAGDDAEVAALDRKEPEDKVKQAVEDARRPATDEVRAALDLVAELEAEQLLATGDAKAALAALEKAKAVPAVQRADMHLAAGDAAKAVEVLQGEAKAKPNRVPVLARLAVALHAAGKTDEARARFEELRTLAGHADLDTPLLARVAPLAAACGAPADWRLPQPPAADVGDRPDLAALGPFRFEPWAAAPLALPAADGSAFVLDAPRERATLVVFYLGFGCLHCVDQLKGLVPMTRTFADAGIDLVAVGTDPADKARESLATFEAGSRPEFTILADPELAAFKAWRCHDDFESMALHGTFLVAPSGRVLWQEVSAQPFVRFDWLLAESRRLLQLEGRATAPAAGVAGAAAGSK
ncbi:MAG: hypothetical protein RL148_113 [Planctomycetota bacterium]